MRYAELPDEARDAITERFPGLAGPLGAGVRWKAAGDTLTGFEGGRLIAVVNVNRQPVVVDDTGGSGGVPRTTT